MAIITKNVTVKLTDNYSLPSNIEFEKLLSVKKDMRKTANGFKDLLIDEEEHKSLGNLPLGGYMISLDDTSSESYYPHSDWQGPSGEAWIGK